MRSIVLRFPCPQFRKRKKENQPLTDVLPSLSPSITHRMELPLPSHSTNEAAIHRLVDDILVYIFELNATLPDPYRRQKKHATTVASSQVCMRWRSIALHCHTIWGPIIDYSRHSLKWIETLLNRSHPAPLDFGNRIMCVYLDAKVAQGVLELVFKHIDRLRVFNLDVPMSSWELVCSRFLQLPVPNLEFVNVQVIFSATVPLAHPLFDHHAPNLRNLHLRHYTVDFTSSILTPLTELYVKDIAYGSAVPTVLDWLNILAGMPSLRWLTLIRAISSATTDITYPIIHLAALEMLSVCGAFHESVTLVEHLIAPPRCGLRFQCRDIRIGFDQRKLWAIIEKNMDSWPKNTPNRHLMARGTQDYIAIGNLPGIKPGMTWGTEAEAVHCERHTHLPDPIMAISLCLSNPQDSVPLFLSLFALFKWTFFDTTHLQLWLDDKQPDVGPEVFLPLVDSFRGFVNLEELYLSTHMYDPLPEFLFPLLQHSLPDSVLLPALQSLRFSNATFRRTSDTLLRVADFLRWRREQGFPVQKINIVKSWIDRQYILTHIQDTVVEIDNSNFSDSSEDLGRG